jgi:hypothetical protein
MGVLSGTCVVVVSMGEASGWWVTRLGAGRDVWGRGGAVWDVRGSSSSMGEVSGWWVTCLGPGRGVCLGGHGGAVWVTCGSVCRPDG